MRNLFPLSLVALAASAQAEWKVLSNEFEPGRAGIEHRHIVLETTAANQRADLDLAIFSAKSCALRVIDNPDGQDLAAVVKREKCVCGVNGGYFDASFQPIGLRIIDGQTIAPLRHARLITGVLLASSRGVQIVRAREFSPHQKKAAVAIQCGPFLVDSLQRVIGLNNSALARRTFAATTAKDRALLGVCSEVSLADLAQILGATPIDPSSKITRALNLDGGSSSAFWFLREDGSAFAISGQKPVRDFVAVAPK
ncbi:MAG TPA: phosphodiester glycosidase family protein [Candidatus Udaeobacter sp.]